MTEVLYPLTLFRFHADFFQVSLNSLSAQAETVPMCQGAFSECSGLEATMEPKVIKAGGWNYGSQQRSGPVTFGTVILKRGITTTRHLWNWFSLLNERGKSAYRLNVKITVMGEVGPPGESSNQNPPLTIWLYRAIPVKFKSGDLNARSTEVGIEEIHLAHEGLSFE